MKKYAAFAAAATLALAAAGCGSTTIVTTPAATTPAATGYNNMNTLDAAETQIVEKNLNAADPANPDIIESTICVAGAPGTAECNLTDTTGASIDAKVTIAANGQSFVSNNDN